MDRSRSKRYYYDQDYESEQNLYSRTKPRYGNNSHHGGGNHYGPSHHHRRAAAARKTEDPSVMVTTSYRILCHDVKAGGVIGKSGSIIKAIRQHTGAWINVHEVIPGDEERIIEISDTRRRDPDGRMPNFSPAQEALILVHDRILETEVEINVRFGDDESDEYGNRGGGNRVVTRLVVSRMHVGSLLGKGGKIIEQMRMETKTHIRVLPRDHTLPRCVSMAEEIVQVVGDMNAVKNAITIISSRLRESQHRDRSNFHNRLNSADNFFDDLPVNSTPRRSSEGPGFGSKFSGGSKSDNHASRSSGPASTVSDKAQPFTCEDLVFRILCPVDKVDSIFGESNGIVDLIENEIGVNVEVSNPVAGLDDCIIIVSSDEGPDDELFPAQEALLHIQTRIVDLVPEKENIITTRLLLQSDEIGPFIEPLKIGGANIEIVPKEQLPAGMSETYEIIQIVGEIKAAREALVEVTSRARSYIYREFLGKDGTGSHVSTPSHVDADVAPGSASRNNLESRAGNGPVVSLPQSTSSSSTIAALPKVKDVGPPTVETVKQNEREDQPSVLSRISVPLVTRSILEVVIPPHASKLVTKSRKLNLISELSGANVKLIEDGPDVTEKIIQISGTPEQAERAQSLLQGFILSTDEDE